MQELLEKRGLSDRFDLVRKFYNGYHFGNVTVYNPWSVINHLRNPTPEPQLHWVNTSDNHLIHKLLTQANTSVKQGLHELLDKSTEHTTTQLLQEHVPLKDIHKNSQHIWSLLLASGYVTAISHHREHGSLKRTVKLRVPNEEVLSIYTDLLDLWMQSERGEGASSLLEALVRGQVPEFFQGFQEFVEESASFFDTGGKQPERFYHAFVLGMTHYVRDRYFIRSERESGTGRYDLALEPKDKNALGFVMEFKKALDVEGSLQKSADSALQQIQDKNYHAELTSRGIHRIIALGFAFKGKQVALAHTTLPTTPSTSLVTPRT